MSAQNPSSSHGGAVSVSATQLERGQTDENSRMRSPRCDFLFCALSAPTDGDTHGPGSPGRRPGGGESSPVAHERATYRVGSPQAWPGPVRSTSLVRCGLPQAVSSLRSPASYTRKLPAVRQRRRAQGMGACTARTCTPRETTVTHLRLQRGALPLAQQHQAERQGLAGGRGQRGRQLLPQRRPESRRAQRRQDQDDGDHSCGN